MQNRPSPDLKSVVERLQGLSRTIQMAAERLSIEGQLRASTPEGATLRATMAGAAADLFRIMLEPDEAATLLLTQKDRLDKLTWQPIETAPKDGSYILAIVAGGGGRHLEHQAGRMFVIRHEGETRSEYDLGWSVYPGFGGARDFNFSHWMPLPEPPALTGSHT